jgi:SPP1 family predicted phage head-tail adaptor
MSKTLAAELRHRVIIQENTGTVNDGAGNQVPLWELVASVPAKVTPVSGNEITLAEKRTQEITHIVKIRYRPNMRKDKHRIIFNGRVMRIQYIINKDELNIQLNLQCKEV